MKINIYLNNWFVKYNAAQKTKNEVENLKIGFIESIYNSNDLFILRGEPTFRDDLYDILKIFKNKNYILTTNCFEPEKLILFNETIPYISFHWDGFYNDIIKGGSGFTYNMFRCLESLSHKKTIFRIAYTISNFNLNYLDVDILTLRKMMETYPTMKQPYFILYQEGEYFNQNNFIWNSFNKIHLDKLNKSGLLTQKNFNYLSDWLNKKPYVCTSIKEEAVIMPDASMRLCQSHQIKKELGSLREKNIKQIFTDSTSLFKEMEHCPFCEKCWLAYNRKV